MPSPVDSLPTPVRRYSERVLSPAPASGRTVRGEQRGEMTLKPGARPRGFSATEEFAIDHVAFAWRARFPLLGPLSLRVTDSSMDAARDPRQSAAQVARARRA